MPTAKMLAQRLETIRVDFEQELGEIRAREEQAAVRIDRLKRLLLTREAALRGSAEQNQRFENILSELRTDLSALRVKAKANLAPSASSVRVPEADAWRIIEAEGEIKRLQEALDARNREFASAQDDIRRVEAALQRAQSDVSQARDSEALHRAQLDASKSERDAFASQVAQLQRSVEGTAAILAELRFAGQRASEKAAEEETKRTAIEGRAEEIEQRFQELLARYERDTQALRDERESLQSQLGRLEDEVIGKSEERREFVAEVDELRKELAVRQDALEQSESRAAALEAKDLDRDGDLRAIHDNIAAGNQRLEEEIRAKIQLENDLVRLREEFESVAELVSRAEQRRQGLEREIAERDAELGSSRRRAKDAEFKYAAEIARLDAALARSSEALNDSGARNERLASESDRLNVRTTELESRVQELLNESNAKEELLRAARDTTDTRSEELDRRIVGLTGDVTELEAERRNLTVELREAARFRDETLGVLAAVREQLSGADGRASGLEEALSEADRRLSRVHDELLCTVAREQFTAARAEAAGRMIGELHGQVIALTEKSARLDLLSAQLDEMQRVVERFRGDEATISRQIERLSAELRQAGDLARDVTEERAALSVENDTLRNRLNALEEALSAAKDYARVLEERARDVSEHGEGLAAALARMTADRDATLCRVQELEAERAGRENEIAENSAERARLRGEIERIEKTREETSRELDSAKHALDARGNEIALAGSRAGELQSRLDDALSELALRRESEDDLSRRAELMRREIESLGETIVALQADLTRRQADSGDAKKELDDVQHHFDTARVEWSATEQGLHEKLATLNGDAGALRGQLAAAEGMVAQWRLQHAAADVELRESQAQIADLVQDGARLEQDLSSRGAAIRSLEQQFAALTAHVEETAQSLARVTGERDELIRQRELFTVELAGLREQVDALNVRLDEGDRTRDATERELSGLRDQLRSADQREQDAHARIATLVSARIVVESKNAKAAALIDKLNVTLADRDKAIAAREEDVETLEGERALAHQSMKDLAKQIAGISGELETVKGGLAEADKRIAELQAMRSEAEQQAKGAHAEMMRLQDQTRRAQEELRDIKDIELPKALEQKVRAFRETQELRQEVELLRRQVW